MEFILFNRKIILWNQIFSLTKIKPSFLQNSIQNKKHQSNHQTHQIKRSFSILLTKSVSILEMHSKKHPQQSVQQ